LGGSSTYLLQNLGARFGISPAYRQIVWGGILIVAVVLGGAVSGDSGGGFRRTGAPLIARSRKGVQSVLTLPDALLSKRERTGEPARADAGGRSGGADRAERLRLAGARFGAVQARYPIAQVVALIVVFIYGAITLPGL